MSLLVVGSIAIDRIETPFGKSDNSIGGAATYIALSASYLTSKVNVVGVIGNDYPLDYLPLLQKHGINTDGVQIKKDEKSFFWHGKYHNDMNTRESLATELNVFMNFDPTIPDSYQDCSYLLLGNMAPQLQQKVIQRLKKRPQLIAMDTMNFWIDTAWQDLLKTLKMVDILSINDEEARQLSQEYSLVKAAKKIMSLGPKFLIIKKGEHGALLFHENQIFFAPALPLEDVFDPTGAGDTFAGGFIGYLANTKDNSFANMKRAIIHGSTMASFCVEKFGTERLINLKQSDIKDRVQEFIDLVQFDISII